MNSVRVSVIVPVYNAKKYLQQCMDALLDQTCRDFEIILVDDGSTDGSAGLCDTFREKDSRVTVIHQANGGPGTARNAGLERATGEYVCFVDADDRVSRDYLLTLTEQMESSGAGLVICSLTTALKELDTKEPKEPLLITRPVVENIFSGDLIDGYFCNKIYRRSIIEAYCLKVPEEVFIWEDMLFFVSYIQHVDSVLFIPDRLYYYRRHDSQLTAYDDRRRLIKAAQRVRSSHLFLACDMDSDAYERWARDLLARNEIAYVHAMLRDSGTPVSDVKAELFAARKAVRDCPNALIFKVKLWILSGMMLGKFITAGRKKRG